MFLERALSPSTSAAALPSVAPVDKALMPRSSSVTMLGATYLVTSLFALVLCLLVVGARSRHPHTIVIAGAIATWWGFRVATGVGVMRRREWARVALQLNFGVAVVVFVIAPFLSPPSVLETLFTACFEVLQLDPARLATLDLPNSYGLTYGFGVLVLALHAGGVQTLRDPLFRSEFC